MPRLLSANFMRLRNDKVLWLGVICMFVLSVFFILSNYLDMKKEGYVTTLDNFFFGYAIIIGIPIAVFCSLYLGTEYSDGTIRNKLVVGHERYKIYLANLIVCVAASFFMTAAFLIPAAALGIPLIGSFSSPVGLILMTIFGSLVMIIALNAIFTLISMLIQNKAIAAVVAVLGIFLLVFAAANISALLSVPETYQEYQYVDDSGELQSGKETPNPDYIAGTKRIVYETVLDILPTGQGLQYSSMSTAYLWMMPLYSLAIIIITTGIGVLLFQRKDIR